MSRQSFIGRIDQPQQLRAVALEVKPTSHELHLTPVSGRGALAKRIGFNGWNVAAILGGHRRLYPSDDDSVKLFCLNAV
jgi:hypothetical protein